MRSVYFNPRRQTCCRGLCLMRGKTVTDGKTLSQPVRQFDITDFDARRVIEQMGEMSFTARAIAGAARIYEAMLHDPECKIILTIAGSASAAGCNRIYADLVRYHMVDAVVATGATLFDMDFFEAIGFRHYRSAVTDDDFELYTRGINRIYDTYLLESELIQAESVLQEIANQL